MEVLNLDLAERSYPITIGENAINSEGDTFKNLSNRNVVVVSNPTISPLYLDKLLSTFSPKSLRTFDIPDGESYKTLDTYQSIISFLLENNVARDVVLIALGGGVIGDIVGFVAATYQRGVDFIQVPTTLLSQVDSSVGGKTAVNHPLGKNMIGAFYQPKSVVIDCTTLASLPAREFAAGMAEVIKYGIIYDGEFLSYIQKRIQEIRSRNTLVMTNLIKRCCEIKARIVEQDEREGGLRAILNLGHTFGHAIEAELGFGVWLHGEAVSAGMVQACELSCLRGYISKSDVSLVSNLLSAFDLPVIGPETMSCSDYLPHMAKDKKVLDGTMRFILPTILGKAEVFDDVSAQELKDILN